VRRAAPALLVGAFALSLRISAAAATITIVNTDAAGQGLNDPTRATPVGGNPGTTIGAQRLNVLKEAARIWGQILPSDVEIKVDASFTPLPCDATSVILGGAAPIDAVADFPGAPLPGTWYAVALANKLSGQDLEPTTSDIFAHFNSNLGSTGCLTGSPFYYGFDTNTPSGQTSFLTVSLHEFAHGLGFLSLVNVTSGELFSSMPDIFTEFILDTSAGKTWVQMSSDSERQASAINTGHVVWSGAHANAAGATYLSGVPFLYVTAPPAAVGNLTVGLADFGGPITQAGVSGTLVAAVDPSNAAGSSTFDACSPLTNASAVAGKIALVDRVQFPPYCTFATKASNVQAAGAIGLVIANYTDGVVEMGGADPTITIPVVSVSISDGAKLRANLPAQVKIGRDPVLKAGMNAAGQMLLYAPNPVEPGSSISHWDTSASPNLLMEQAISSDLPIGVDITPDLFRDLGWFGATPSVPSSYYLPSVARSAGGTVAAPAYYTSDVFVANRGGGTANYTLKFLGHDQDGTTGPERSFSIPAGNAATFRDVLGFVFSLLSDHDYGAIRITADTAGLKITSVTTTPTPDGTGAYGQSVPAAPTAQLITAASPGTIVGLREDTTARTNLVLLNATESPLDVDLALWDDNGPSLGTSKETLPPLGMKQIGRVIEHLTGARNSSNATLVLSTSTAGGAFTAFASLINNLTNDPATLLPRTGLGNSGQATLLVPSTARTAGGTPTAPAFYTTDLFVANRGSQTAGYKLKYLAANTTDGTLGPEKSYTLNAGTAETFRDVLGKVFGLSSNADFGAIQISSDSPSLAIDSVTTTPNPTGPGRFGQSVPGVPASQWTPKGATATIAGIREDAPARTNLVLVNTTLYLLEIDIALYGDDGTSLGPLKKVFLPRLGMTQIGRIVEYITGARNTSNATLVLSTPTPAGSFTAFASLINNITNDPATLLPQ
jgi:hypothetical protein